MSNGILPLTDETLHLLHAKHPEMQHAPEDVLLQGPIEQVHFVNEAISETLISKVMLKTNGNRGASGFDAEDWRRILAA